MDDTIEPPELPDLGGKIPKLWHDLIAEIGKQHPTTAAYADELKARLQVWALFTDLRARQLEAQAAERHAKSMRNATWVLAGATLVLAIATVALIFATLA